jgi:threonine dehydrogenase-like Zn-dependent dehydrogenase
MEQSMQALIWLGGDALQLESVPSPVASDGDAVVEIRIAGICGSDLHAYRGEPGPRRPPLILGHEAIGTVPGRPGRYAIFPLVACGECRSCLAGEENLCAHRGLLGLDRAGVFADAVRVAEHALVQVPEGLDDRQAVLVEPLATGLSVLEYEHVEPGDTVLVVGCGPIGLLTIYAATARGARVVAAEPIEARRALATQLGAERVEADAAALSGELVDLAVDCVGIEPTWRTAIDCVRSGSSVVVVGLGQADGGMPVGNLVRRGVAVRGHYAYRRRDFDAALQLLTERPLPVDWLTVMPLEAGAEGFRRLTDEPQHVTKVLLEVRK